MRVIRFYQCSLALPLAVPALVWLFRHQVPANAFGNLLAWTIPSGVYGAVPYLPFALALAVWLQRKPARRARRFSFIVPL
jgi:hypothetical protein